jgi:hypothetical protein
VSLISRFCSASPKIGHVVEEMGSTKNWISFCAVPARHFLHSHSRHLACSTRMADAGSEVKPGELKFDRSVFAQRWLVYGLPIPPKLCQGAIRALKDHVLRVPRVSAVLRSPVHNSENSDRVILLRYFARAPPEVPFAPRGNMDREVLCDVGTVSARLRSLNPGPKVDNEVKVFLNGIQEKNFVESPVELDYEHWPVDAVLSYLLPKGITM